MKLSLMARAFIFGVTVVIVLVVVAAYSGGFMHGD